MSPDVIILKMIKNYMELENDRVWIGGQGLEAPRDDGIFIVVTLAGSEIISSYGGPVSPRDVPKMRIRRQVSILQSTVEVDVYSRGRDAVNRHHEVLMAVTSAYAENMASEECVKITRSRNITNLTAVEGADALYRFQYQMFVKWSKEQRPPVDIYDNFRQTAISQEV